MLKKFGAKVRQKFEEQVYILGYFGKVLIASLFFPKRGKAARKILTMQLLFTYVEALPICTILAATIGSAIFILGNNFFLSIGQIKLTYELLVLIVVRELGPLLIAFIVTARSATAIATEIGGNVVSHEIEAYISIGVDPIAHLVVPRFLGVTLSLFFLNIYFILAGLLAPIFIAQFVTQINFYDYINNIFYSLSIKQIYISIIKSIVFGMGISINATIAGFNVQRASTEVPIAGIQAVGNAILFTILADVFISILSYIFT